MTQEVVQPKPRIDHAFHEDHLPPLNVDCQVVREAYPTAIRGEGGQG